MKITKNIAPWLATAAIVTAIGFAPFAATAAAEPAPVVTTTQAAPADDAGTDPLVPFGVEPTIPYQLGLIDPDHDNADTTNGQVDLPS
jgi:hypothetical protein